MDGNVGFSSNVVGQRTFGGAENATETVQTVKKKSNFLSFMYLLKGFLGMGFYTIPYVMVHGHVSFIIGMFVFPICVYILVNVCKQMGGGLSYPETAEAACLSCSITQKFSTAASVTVKIFLFLSTIFLCSLYLGFITSHVEKIVSYNMGEYVNYYVWLVILTLPLLVLCLIPLLYNMAIIGVFFQLLTIIMFYGVFVAGDFPSEIGVSMKSFSNQLLRFVFTGLITTLLEGISIVLVVENNMKYPSRMIGCPSLLCAVMTIVVLLNALCGLLAFLRFGSLTRLFVTLSTPSYTALGQTTLICAALSIYFTYPLQFNVGFMIFWDYIEPQIKEQAQKPLECTFRVFFVMVTAGVALINPDFIAFHIILHGGLFLTLLGVIMPIFLQICVLCSKAQDKRHLIFLSICLVLSFIFMFYITSVTLYEYFNPKMKQYNE